MGGIPDSTLEYTNAAENAKNKTVILANNKVRKIL